MKAGQLELAEFTSMSKVQVRALADALFTEEPETIERCVRFVCAETVNLWHGRGRAMICRRLKHIGLAKHQKERLVENILHRLSSGRFSEQFRDQLRLALYLDPKGTCEVAKRLMESEKYYVRRYAAWVLTRTVVSGR